LYLNIWAPAKSAGEHLPVLVYFYGGGLITGDGSEFRYEGEVFAKKGIIAITVNYRLGVFGFMAHPGLTAESKHHSSGNYGLMDQTEALRWVQKNIAAFGGDPKKVTIGGESAGSFSVSAQMASPLAKGLFAGAIGESGSLLASKSTVALKDGEDYGTKFMASVGASSLEDLRKLPADKLLEATAKPEGSHFSVTVDGYFFSEAPAKIFAEGKQASVPLLVGWNSAEADYTALLPRRTEVTVDNYKKALQAAYGDHADEVFKVYPATTPDEVRAVATDLASDRMIAYGTWLWASLHAATGHKPVYHYIFDHPRPLAVTDVNKPLPTTKQGARHSWEIEYALGNLATNKVYAWTADDYKISDIMNTYFSNFIKTGNPNGNGLPKWDELQKPHPTTMWIDVNTRPGPFKDTQRYQVLKSLDH
jgi:para-nitrobenzyl esterase